MKTLITLYAVLFGFAGFVNAQADTESLFVVLTSDDAETQMMAMVLATQSLNKDVSVRILLCSNAGDLALKGSESPIFAPADRSPKQLLMSLMDQGVRVEVCGIYLPNRDHTEADLIEGIGTAAPPEVAEFMKQEGVRYFTF
ncbi:DsrE family protein [Rhodohalobacter halophilus]|uniref:DsrE family protein n=1 Tax=Rhodohalobacter halophilus TaxID=1812810 RepID=UPI00083F782C|nr:DsrE family protein [Rhodohalobacter halophilus]